MVRARVFRVALAAALGLACGCSTPSGCPNNNTFGSRLTSLFRRDRAREHEIDCCPADGPVIADPGACCDGPGCAAPAPPPSPFPPMPQTFAPPLAQAVRPIPANEAQRVPYQP
jgi:hypothetical protein